MIEWKTIEGFPDYEVSALGIRRIGTDKLMHIGHDIKGYPCCYLKKPNTKNKHGKGLNRVWLKIHRAVAMAFIPNPENKPCINHKNAIKTDYRIENLEWCTYAENNKHAKEMGLCKPVNGESVWKSKLTEVEVLDMKTMYQNGATKIDVWNKYKHKVSRGRIYGVLNGRDWKHVVVG